MNIVDRHTYYASKSIVQLIADELPKPPTCGIEIGVHTGVTSMMLLRYFPNLHLYMIDPYQVYGVERTQEEHDQCFEEARLRTDCFNGRRQQIRKTSRDAKNLFPLYFADFVFIDGDHSYAAVHDDLRCYFKGVKKGGLIVCHDVKQSKVYFALKNFCADRKITFKYGRAKSGWFRVNDGADVEGEYGKFVGDIKTVHPKVD